MAFDPDAYLQGSGFNPDAYLGEAPQPMGPSRLDALGRGAAQGATLGFGDEIQGAIQALLPPPGGDPRGYFGGLADRYRAERDAARAGDKSAREAHGTSYLAGNLVGGAAPTVLLPATRAAQGAGLGAKVLAGAKTAAPVGALYGAGGSEADSLGGVAADTAIGAAGGAVVGGAAPVVGAAAGKVLTKASDALGERAYRYGQQAIRGVSGSLARRKEMPREVVDEAFRAGAIRPGSTVKGIADRLQDAADPLSQEYARILGELERRGVTGPNASKLAMDFIAQGAQVADNTIVGTRARALGETGRKLLSKSTQGEAPGGDLGLMQAEFMKRELQQAAANDFVKEGTQSLSGAARKELAGRFREEIENAVAAQASKAPDEAAAFVPVKQQLSRTLEALGAAREGAARYARRSPIGLHEGMGLASGIASGNPISAVAGAGALHALKDRGVSTAAWLAHGGARDLARLAGVQAPRSASGAATALTPEMEALIEALRRRASVQPIPAAAEEDR